MINLIGNEFKKVFKKKTIYILLIIIVGYILLSNIMIKITDNGYQYNFYYEGDLEYYEDLISNLDPNNPAQFSDFAEYKRNIEILELTKKYGNNTWQAYVINTKLTGYIDTMIEYEYSEGVTEETYNTAKSEYDEAIKRLDSDDWKYFANKDIEFAQESLDEQYALLENAKGTEETNEINRLIANLKLDIQINKWRLDKDISYAPSFLNSSIEEYYNYQTTLNEYVGRNVEELSGDEYQYYQNALETASLDRYYIENNISLDSNSRDVFINLFGNYELFILIVGIVIAGSIVSDEFNRGTIKLLLVKPYSRVKILLSKFIVCMLILILTIAFIYVFQFLAGGVINGFDGMTIPAIVYNFDTSTVETMNLFAYVALIGFCKLLMYILLTTLAFTCSTLFTNTALAVSIPFLGYIGANIINQLALLYNIKQVIYFVTPNWDLSCYLFGGSPLFKELTPTFSIIVCVIYLIIMLVLNCIVFKKRDIKNI